MIDGASTDGTVGLLEQTAEVKWVSEIDAGQTAAINKGFRLSAGEIVSWLNADDELLPGAVEKAVSALLREQAGCAYGNLKVVDGGRVEIRTPSRRPSLDLFAWGKGGVIPQPGTLIVKEVLDSVGGLDESFHLAMDFDLWVRLMDAGVPLVYVPETLAVFEIHSDSKTGKLQLSDFILEEARALEKGRHHHLADLARGRAAAHRAFVGRSIPPRRLRQEVERIWMTGENRDPRVAKRIKAAARTEAGLFEMQNFSLLGVRHLLARDPWLVKQTRARILHAAFRTLRAPIHFLEHKKAWSKRA